MSISILQPGQTRTRKPRSPNFPIAGKLKPFGLYPLWAHVVLPGETLKSFSMKWRAVSMPVKHHLAGCWMETWLAYVKLTDIDRDLSNMFISDSYSTSGWTASSDNARYFTKTGQIAWIQKAVERVHDAYFMDPDETAREIDGVRKTKLSSVSWYQNAMFKPADDAPTGADVISDYQEMNAYLMMQQMQLTEITYERMLQQYGVTNVKTEEGWPEILRYARSWTLPVNTIDPSSGAPSSAWVWSDEVKGDKDKRFQEPGILVAMASVRPKMYQKHLSYSMLGELWGLSDFFPAYLLDDPTAGIKTLSSSNSVFHADHRTDAGDVDILFDQRDLLSHGEQFVNDFTQAPYALPLSTGLTAEDTADLADLRGEYASDTDIASLFVSGTASDQFVNYEGMAHCVISGHIKDTTTGGR